MAIVTIHAGLDDRMVRRKAFELIAVGKCEHLEVRTGHHLFQGIGFRLRLGKVGLVNQGADRRQPPSQIVHSA